MDLITLPKPRTDRAWSDNPIFEKQLKNQHRKMKESKKIHAKAVYGIAYAEKEMFGCILFA